MKRLKLRGLAIPFLTILGVWGESFAWARGDGTATPMLGTATPLVGSGSATPVVSGSC